MKSIRGAGRLLGIALACALMIALPLACNPGSSGSSGDEYLEWRLANPDIDARGGDVYSYRGQFSPQSGYGGAGGLVEVESLGGTLTIQRTAVAVVPPTQTLSGGATGGLRIGPGHIVHIQGGHYYDWVDVEPNGTLVLTGDTTLIVGDPNIADGLGDVYIGGIVQSSRFHTLAGHTLTIIAKGKIHIAGVIDCSGADGSETFGGAGGEVYIVTTHTDPDSFTLTGQMSANGGGSEGASPVYSVGGRGGSIRLAANGGMRIQGAVRARGGDSLTSLNTNTPAGGTVRIAAAGDLAVTGILQVSARGGDSDGSPGAGGSVSIAASNNSLNLLGVRILADGGSGLRGSLTDAGDGGTIDLAGLTVTSSSEILSRGGSILSDAYLTLPLNSLAGDGGTITIAASTNIAFTGGRVSAEGGAVEMDGFVGNGGNLRVAGLDPSAAIQAALGWTGTVAGGIGPRGERGIHGSVCVTGSFSSVQDAAYFYDQLPHEDGGCGTDFFPIVTLPFEIDDDDATARPSEMTAVIPAGIGYHFWRVYVGSALALTISTTGEPTGDIDLYVGPEAVFGSTNLADYTYASETTGDSSEEVDYDPAAGAFLSVLVVERSGYAEEYTLRVSE